MYVLLIIGKSIVYNEAEHALVCSKKKMDMPMKRMVFSLLFIVQTTFCYQKQCRGKDPKNVIVDDIQYPTYSFKQGSGATLETCYVTLEEEEKINVIETLMPFAKEPLVKDTIEKFSSLDHLSARKVVYDFVTFKTQERDSLGPIFKTIEDVINTINPQGYAKPISGTAK